MRFLKRINWRQIVVQVIAMWFIMAGVTFLSFLNDIELLQSNWAGNGPLPDENGNIQARLIAFLTSFALFTGIGKIVGFLILLGNSIKQKWFWGNAVLAFIFYMLSARLYTITSVSLPILILQSLGSNDFLYFLLAGTLCLTAALLLFFLKPVIRFINRYYENQVT